MATAAKSITADPDRRDGFFIHQIQKGYAVWIGVLLFLYSALFFAVAFYGTHLRPMLTLYSSESLEERQSAAAEMLMLSETVWIVLPILFFGAIILSLILTRRVAGPLYRLDESVGQWLRGNLRWQVRFRPSDRLDDLAGTANQALANIEQAFGHIEHQTRILQGALLKIEQAGPSGIEEARDAVEDISAILQRFEFRPLTDSHVKSC